MNEGLIPRRYAKALFEFASERGETKRVYGLMKSLASAFVAEGTLQSVMSNPFIDAADKVNLLVVATGSEKKDQVFNDFISLLIANKRLELVREIALAYLDIYRKANNIYLVEVVTASELSKDDETRLKSLIQRHLNGGTMEYSCHVDSELIGGFVVNIGSERLDASVSNELKQLRLNLLRN